MAQLDRIQRWITWLALIAIVIVYGFLSQNVYFGDSEFYSFFKARDEGWGFAATYKPILYLILKGVTALSPQDFTVYLIGRSVFWIISIFNLYLVYLLWMRVKPNSTSKWLPSIFLAAFSIYIERSYRVRADMIMISVSLVYLIYIFDILKEKHLNKWDNLASAVMALIFEALFVLVSIKGIVFITVFQFFWAAVLLAKDGDSYKRLEQIFVFKYAISAVTIFGVLLYFDATLSYHLPISAFLNELGIYVKNSYEGGAGMAAFFTKTSFGHLGSLLIKNPIFSLFIYISLLVTFVKWIANYFTFSHLKTNLDYLNFFALIMFFAFLGFPEKFPFFICSIVPTMAMVGSRRLHGFLFWLNQKKKWIRESKRMYYLAAIIIVVISVVKITKRSQFLLMNNNNKSQFTYLYELDRYLDSYQGLIYYDVIGLFPKYKAFHAFLGPSQSDRNLISGYRVRNQLPDIMIFVNKHLYISDYLNELAGDFYMPLGYGIHARALKLSLDIQFEDVQILGEPYKKIPIKLFALELSPYSILDFDHWNYFKGRNYGQSSLSHIWPLNPNLWKYEPLKILKLEDTKNGLSRVAIAEGTFVGNGTKKVNYAFGLTLDKLLNSYEFIYVPSRHKAVYVSPFSPLEVELPGEAYYIFDYDRDL